MRHRALLVVITLALLAASLATDAQQTAGPYRVGWLHPAALPAAWMEGFREGLREFGYVEGKDLVIEYRWGDGRFDRLPAMAADLVRLNVDALIAGNTAAVLALRDATRSIPIVMTGTNDPVGTGLVPSLARPGGNITGLSGVGPDLSGKRLELLKEVVPGLTKVTALSNPQNPSMALVLRETEDHGDLALELVHLQPDRVHCPLNFSAHSHDAVLHVLGLTVFGNVLLRIIVLAAGGSRSRV